MTWTDAAWRTMETVRVDGVRAGKRPDEIVEAIDAAYPFGERARWPYRAWLNARKEFFARYGLPMPTKKKTSEPDLFSFAKQA